MKVSKLHYSENKNKKRCSCSQTPREHICGARCGFVQTASRLAVHVRFCDLPGEEALVIGDVCVPDTSVHSSAQTAADLRSQSEVVSIQSTPPERRFQLNSSW